MKRILFLLSFCLSASPALAHVGAIANGSVMAGIAHPLLGADHLMTMIAVGLWASTLGGRASWVVPSAFVGFMVLGFGAGLGGIVLPIVEPMILASVVVSGLLVAAAVRLDVKYAAILVGVFAVAHGFAHAGEIGQASAMAFGVGFVVTTATLLGVGIGLGLIAKRASAELSGSSQTVVRWFGTAAVLAGFGFTLV